MEIGIDQVEGRIQEEFQKKVNEAVKVLKSVAPADTGAMRAEIHAEKVSDDVYWVGTNKWYAKFTEYGRKDVFPVVKQALYWPELGHPVRHAKGVPPMHWVEKAVAQLR